MKTSLPILLLLSIILIGCNNQVNDTPKANKENPPTKAAPKSTDNNNNLITNQAAGIFSIGKIIPFPETSDDYTIKAEQISRKTEEGPVSEKIYTVIQGGERTLQLKPTYDFETETYTKNIDEIIVFSPEFKTPKGIGVNSSIEDFVKAYPDYKIWYTYVSGMYVIESPQVKAQFILNTKDFIGKLNPTSDMTPLKLTDFKQGARILKVRVI